MNIGMAQNTCFFFRTFLIVLSILILFGKVIAGVNQCGTLTIEQPTILGRNVTFTFTPETTSDADVNWQRAKERNPCAHLPNDNKFTQYFQDGTYYLILTDTVIGNDEVLYRVDYRNKSVSCSMETPKLQLQNISDLCGFVYLRTTNVTEGENVELEYYPSKFVMRLPEYTVRQWMRSTNKIFQIILTKGLYEEEKEPNDKYVLTLTMFNERMNGRYGVYCGEAAKYSNFVDVILPVAPKTPVFEGLKDIDDCKGCIVGEDGDQFSVLCKTSGGTQPITVTMSIGNESLSPVRYNDTADYMAFFFLRNRHHMANMTCTVMNDALTSPFITTAPVYVINAPVEFNISGSILNISEGERAYVKCSVKSLRTFNISRVEHTDDGNMYQKHCLMKTDYVIVIDAYRISQRHLNCQASSLQTTEQETLTVNIYEKSEQRFNKQDTSGSGGNSFIWIIISSCLTAVLIGAFIAGLVAVKKLKTAKAQSEANQVRHRGNFGGTSRNDVELEDRAYERLNDTRHATGQSETLYSQLSS
ncbi:uncharacterized protein LOC123563871 isoform X1 [Mercenaria mercenaria]|uniref:uncharacterized protein LOC123563871 isoform X1 n=1 Tax=Mercenaria mercenaria TaxID=6596 RepID=UPI00234F1D0D|nr:uncharacterized protein LOC123563871 isoform X1 [Mercenaria mercenaria]